MVSLRPPRRKIEVIEHKAPAPLDEIPPGVFTVFLAGSIEMGKAEDWQQAFIKRFKDTYVEDFDKICFLNPRRDEWDESWEQSIHNPEFKKQVDWELDALEHADMVAMNLLPDTKSPISLMELGYMAHSGSLVIHCPDGFWRKGNVDVIANRCRIPVVRNITALAGAVYEKANNYGRLHSGSFPVPERAPRTVIVNGREIETTIDEVSKSEALIWFDMSLISSYVRASGEPPRYDEFSVYYGEDRDNRVELTGDDTVEIVDGMVFSITYGPPL